MAILRVRICPFERLITWVEPCGSVLDVGCGAGLFLALLAGFQPSLKGVGFDRSKRAIDAATQMINHARRLGLPAELRFLHLDVMEPWSCGTFDVVSVIDLLHHLAAARQQALFQKAASFVKPGGILLYKDMSNRPLAAACMNRLHDLVVARQWIRYRDVLQVDQWARDLGLEIEKSETVNRLWYCHELRSYRKPLSSERVQRDG